MIAAAHDLTRTCMHVIVYECSAEFSEAIPSMLLVEIIRDDKDEIVAEWWWWWWWCWWWFSYGNSSGSDGGSGGSGGGGSGGGGGGGGGAGGERTLGVGLKGRIGEGMRASGLVVCDKTSGVDRRRRCRRRRFFGVDRRVNYYNSIRKC
ncbi:hypothetical protein HZH68_004672 [Vespula germanica]|uniref:Uncharacterized protein n=1 Tax=Vespula germanica TaxID=30212 RepID=A0A834KR04_VESGE|nr:hypothetical protein HZH68_004672 [Vespula germanica]